MAKSLVVVESPTKVKTLSQYLGKEYIVKASVGHVIDLPKSKLGIEIGETFEPKYEVIKGKQKILNEIRSAAQKVQTVYLAPDPDREGEAIAWHIADAIRNKGKKKSKNKGEAANESPKILRVLIDEITKKGVERAMSTPGELDLAKFNSQQARRILDRLVGYKISPLLWEKVSRGLSAGRVQSVALRIICEREKDIQKFIPTEYWTIEVDTLAKEPPVLRLRLVSQKGEKIEISNEVQAKQIEQELGSCTFQVQDIQKKQRKRTPPAAFTTSKLQQEASRKLGFGAKRTMMLAQQLYEGIEIAQEGQVGLITYMRTDSTRLSMEAIDSARQYISDHYPEFLPEKPRLYRVSKKAQDAHEAIRPTNIQYAPELIKQYLRKDQFSLYRLIWDRFIACQMEDAKYDQTTIDVKAKDFELRATGSVLAYEGFMRLYVEGTDDEEASESGVVKFPSVQIGEMLALEQIIPGQHFTKPPARFTEASLVKELEENGIGRPSTYASILSTLQDRKYVVREQGTAFQPTDLGFIINDLLVEHFKDIVDVEFTAQMESQLDLVEEGESDWQKVLHQFYEPFEKDLELAKQKMRDVKREETPTDHKCEKCGQMMIIKWGRHGHFLACSNYPECRNTKEFEKTSTGEIKIVQQQTSTDEKCDNCNSPMVIKVGRFGKFLACSRYPDCKTTRSISTGVPCPEKDCDGKLLERRSKRGRVFYGCSRYPKCNHASWNKPIHQPCPQCKAPYLVEKYTKRDGAVIQCPNKDCGYVQTKTEGDVQQR